MNKPPILLKNTEEIRVQRSSQNTSIQIFIQTGKLNFYHETKNINTSFEFSGLREVYVQ